ncbi:MAG: hypothetical protein QXW04_01675 [Candidatus Aenigmatarchaeota archaeon]|nr:hypothetical protein [Candidatus Aenigmarchaeota archaeon]
MEKILKDEKIELSTHSQLSEIFIRQILERIDFIDVLILKKFYLTGKEFPGDTQPYCLPFLHSELKIQHQISLTLEGLRKRLNTLVKLGLLKKIDRTNPVVYFPKEDMKDIARRIIFKFFERYGFESLIKDLMKYK